MHFTGVQEQIDCYNLCSSLRSVDMGYLAFSIHSDKGSAARKAQVDAVRRAANSSSPEL